MDAETVKLDIARIEANIAVTIAYAQIKLDARDWQGVSSAAHDLRELNVELMYLRLYRESAQSDLTS